MSASPPTTPDVIMQSSQSYNGPLLDFYTAQVALYSAASIEYIKMN